jgi:serine phosphatase RsbU (regulator of sigma subunit)
MILQRAAIVLFALLSAATRAQSPILIDDTNLGQSFASHAVILEDAGQECDIEDVEVLDSTAFEPIPDDIGILDFNTSRWWLRFSIQNGSSYGTFYIETARPITNKAVMYEYDDFGMIRIHHAGDDYSFDIKEVKHRKCIFKINMHTGQTKHFVLMLESDGEVITLPLKVYEESQFLTADNNEQFFNGIYFGLLALVIIIFFTFYTLLRDRSFLYYVIYVVGQFLMQFTLDGYTFQFIFPSNAYWVNHSVPISAGLAVFFVLLYARSFLKTASRHRGMDRFFRISAALVAVVSLIQFIPGPTYTTVYPIINGLSLISVISILVAIGILSRKGYHINRWFTAAQVILIAGAIIFILGNFNIVGDAEHSLVVFKIASALEMVALSISMAGKYRELQMEKERAQQEVLQQLEEKNRLAAEINVRLEQQVKERTAEIELQKEQLAEKNHEILDSIRYASRIQKAILPPQELVRETLGESFVLYKPRDIVSGDFYFVSPVHTTTETPEKLALFAAVDCTGHGVPGAFMSIVGSNYLSAGLSAPQVNTTGQALDYLNEGVLKTLRQQLSAEERIRDGMDIAFCALNRAKSVLHFSGAKNPLYHFRNGELTEIKGDKRPIGEFAEGDDAHFKTHQVDLQPGDMIYVFTDGYADQFGGPEVDKGGKKFGYKKYKELLSQISGLPMNQQVERLEQAFYAWKGDLEQVDDVCIIGVRV